MSRLQARKGELVLTVQVRETAIGRFFWQCRAADHELLAESDRDFATVEACFLDACRLSSNEDTLPVDAATVA
jgi:hypothetical protein